MVVLVDSGVDDSGAVGNVMGVSDVVALTAGGLGGVVVGRNKVVISYIKYKNCK